MYIAISMEEPSRRCTYVRASPVCPPVPFRPCFRPSFRPSVRPSVRPSAPSRPPVRPCESRLFRSVRPPVPPSVRPSVRPPVPSRPFPCVRPSVRGSPVCPSVPSVLASVRPFRPSARPCESRPSVRSAPASAPPPPRPKLRGDFGSRRGLPKSPSSLGRPPVRPCECRPSIRSAPASALCRFRVVSLSRGVAFAWCRFPSVRPSVPYRPSVRVPSVRPAPSVGASPVRPSAPSLLPPCRRPALNYEVILEAAGGFQNHL